MFVGPGFSLYCGVLVRSIHIFFWLVSAVCACCLMYVCDVHAGPRGSQGERRQEAGHVRDVTKPQVVHAGIYAACIFFCGGNVETRKKKEVNSARREKLKYNMCASEKQKPVSSVLEYHSIFTFVGEQKRRRRWLLKDALVDWCLETLVIMFESSMPPAVCWFPLYAHPLGRADMFPYCWITICVDRSRREHSSFVCSFDFFCVFWFSWPRGKFRDVCRYRRWHLSWTLQYTV